MTRAVPLFSRTPSAPTRDRTENLLIKSQPLARTDEPLSTARTDASGRIRPERTPLSPAHSRTPSQDRRRAPVEEELEERDDKDLEDDQDELEELDFEEDRDVPPEDWDDEDDDDRRD